MHIMTNIIFIYGIVNIFRYFKYEIYYLKFRSAWWLDTDVLLFYSYYTVSIQETRYEANLIFLYLAKLKFIN